MAAPRARGSHESARSWRNITRQEQSKNPAPRPLTTHPQTLLSQLKSTSIHPCSSPPSPAALADSPMSNVMSTSPQAFEAILFPTSGVPRFVQLTTSARLLIDPISGQAKTTLVPMPELYLPASPNGWRSQRFDALYGMTVRLPQTYVVYHTPSTPIINTTIQQMQGKHYRAEMSWRGDVLVAKFLRRGGSSETLEIADCEGADYALVKNYLSTYCPAS
ncbi:hypothetical protein BKA62DRAFT_703412 [Auriculariales sp. MPI-PUGE-AT-0066]|nr:hypothetical protein BKA62DRAFT_703412 [Auriculariales sp. MPI-PUGE-AT-0066]